MPSAGAWSCWRGSAVRSLLVPAVWTWRLGHCLSDRPVLGTCLQAAVPSPTHPRLRARGRASGAKIMVHKP